MGSTGSDAASHIVELGVAVSVESNLLFGPRWNRSESGVGLGLLDGVLFGPPGGIANSGRAVCAMDD